MADDLSGLAMSPMFLLREFFDAIEPLAARVRTVPDAGRWDFYVRLMAYLVVHARQVGLPRPHETALFVVRLVEGGASRSLAEAAEEALDGLGPIEAETGSDDRD